MRPSLCRGIAAVLLLCIACSDPTGPGGGRPIFFANFTAGEWDIGRVTGNGSGFELFTDYVGDDLFPVVSRDGAEVAFWSVRGLGGIHRRSLESGTVTRVTNRRGQSVRPSW